MVELTRKQLEAVLLSHHRIHPDKQETFRSRIKTLQRMGFPPGTNVGRGPKASYTAEHLLMLVTAFELQQVGLPSERAINAVLIGWDYLKTGYGVAFQLRDQFNPSEEKILAWIHGRTLAEMQIDPAFPIKHPGAPFATAITASEFVRRLKMTPFHRLQYSYLVLDLSDIIASVVPLCEHAAGVDAVNLGLELHRWADHQGGYIMGGHPLRPETEGAEDDFS